MKHLCDMFPFLAKHNKTGQATECHQSKGIPELITPLGRKVYTATLLFSILLWKNMVFTVSC